MENQKRQVNWYWKWMAGAVFGVEFFEDDDGGFAVCISLGIIRFLRTRNDVATIS